MASEVGVSKRVDYGQDQLRLAVDRALHRIVVDDNDCWVFQGAKSHGYGRIKVSTAPFQARYWHLHRAVYTVMVAPVPDDLVMDHLCRNRACCNPEHLEPVTNWENLRRGQGWVATNAAKTHCAQGHEFTPENTRIRGGSGRAPYRVCKECHRQRDAKRDRRKVKP